MNQLISDEGDCKTAPATPGLLNIGEGTHGPTMKLHEVTEQKVVNRWWFAKTVVTRGSG